MRGCVINILKSCPQVVGITLADSILPKHVCVILQTVLLKGIICMYLHHCISTVINKETFENSENVFVYIVHISDVTHYS